jgi:hypothetical protein
MKQPRGQHDHGEAERRPGRQPAGRPDAVDDSAAERAEHQRRQEHGNEDAAQPDCRVRTGPREHEQRRQKEVLCQLCHQPSAVVERPFELQVRIPFRHHVLSHLALINGIRK